MSNPKPAPAKPTAQQRKVLRCLADIQQAEMDNYLAFTPYQRAELVEQRLKQTPSLN